MLASLPFVLAPGRPCPRDRALAPCILASYVYMQRQEQETNRQAMERKRCPIKRHKVDNYDRHGKQRNKKASKQARRQTSKKGKQ